MLMWFGGGGDVVVVVVVWLDLCSLSIGATKTEIEIECFQHATDKQTDRRRPGRKIFAIDSLLFLFAQVSFFIFGSSLRGESKCTIFGFKFGFRKATFNQKLSLGRVITNGR